VGLKSFAGVLLSVGVVIAAGAAAEAVDCKRCHQNPPLRPSLKGPTGVARSLYIDPEAFKKSWHGSLSSESDCIVCHDGVDRFPHGPQLAPRCWDCHTEDLRRTFRAIAATVSESVHFALGCGDCHDPHRGRAAAKMTLEEKNGLCLRCHAHGKPGAGPVGVGSLPLPAYHAWHPQAELHLERMACVVCHTTLEEAGDIDKHRVLEKARATRRCDICHTSDSKVADYLIDLKASAGVGGGREDLLERIYLVGGTRSRAVEGVGRTAALLSVLGVLLHAAGRLVCAHVRSHRRPS